MIPLVIFRVMVDSLYNPQNEMLSLRKTKCSERKTKCIFFEGYPPAYAKRDYNIVLSLL